VIYVAEFGMNQVIAVVVESDIAFNSRNILKNRWAVQNPIDDRGVSNLDYFVPTIGSAFRYRTSE
jgi:hypothetical protein